MKLSVRAWEFVPLCFVLLSLSGCPKAGKPSTESQVATSPAKAVESAERDPRSRIVDLYARVLNRAPSEDEIEGRLHLAGGASANPGLLASSLVHSEERVEKMVSAEIRKILGRDASTAETNFWVKTLMKEGGPGLRELDATLLAGEETLQLAQTNFDLGSPEANFTAQVYRTMLHRLPSDEEIGDFRTGLARHSRRAVVIALLVGTEYSKEVVTAWSSEEVPGSYVGSLGTARVEPTFQGYLVNEVLAK